MNRMQRMSWWMVICIGIAVIVSAIAVTILYFRIGFPKAWVGLSFMGLGGFGGLGPLIFRKDPGSVQADERDRMIQVKSTQAGFTASYLVFGCLAMGIWIYNGPDKLINVNTLPQIWIIAFLTAFFVQALTTLILYGKDNKTEGDAA